MVLPLDALVENQWEKTLNIQTLVVDLLFPFFINLDKPAMALVLLVSTLRPPTQPL